jgi:hypothetical protein
MADETPTAFEKVITWFKDTADWVQENLGDPALATTVREDLGLAAGEDIPEAKKNQIATFGAGLDPDKTSFAETAAELADIIQALIALGDDLKEDQASGWDVFYLIFRVMASEHVRIRSSFAYGVGKLLLLVTEDPEAVEELDPALLVGVLRGEPPPPGTGEAVLQRVGALTWVVITLLDKLAEKLFAEPGDPTDYFESYYGWDPDPASTTPAADLVSARAVTLLFGPIDQPLGARLSVTFLVLPAEHRGPALFFSFGGALNAEVKRGDTTFKLLTGVTGGLDLTIPVGSSTLEFDAGGAPQAFVRFDVVKAKNPEPAFRIGSPTGTRFEIERTLVGIELAGDRAAMRVGLGKAALVIDLTEGDGLLGSLPGGEIRIDLSLVLTLDTENGLRIEGGTQARAVLPINASLFGVFTIHHLEIVLGPSPSGRDLTLELSGAFSLHLGPFTATVDRIGMQLDAAIRQGNLGVLDAALGFKPPNGLGLALDAGIVKGGGYLFIDHVRGEYAGALELTIGPVSVKAIGLLSTKVPLPDGGEGWALLLLLYFEFPPIQLGFGFTLDGVGGMIGLHHGVSVDALTSGLRDGVLDDILFPKNPVADAPRIVNRLRVVFPVTVRAITFGPMLKLGWGTPAIVTVSVGFIVQLDNVLPPGNAPVEFSRFVLVGQLRVQMLPETTGTPPLLKLLVDILGYYDAEAQKLGFVARLRDSKVAEITLSGMLVVQASFGEQPSFVLAAGGFHPRFKDIPPGTPAPIDRLAVGFNISVVKITIEGYFAVAAATVQAGATLRAQAKFGPLSIDGWLGFDAIFYFEPRFHFEVDVRAGVAVKYKGHNLASVDLKGTFSGPGLWRITGSVSFEILFWDIEKSFDESIGSAPETPAISIDVAALVRQELSKPGNWTAQLPAGGQGMVTLGSIEGVEGVLAHPLGQLQVTQRVAPLGLTLQRFGHAQVAGANRFEIAEVRVGSQVLGSPPTVTESFARSHFVEMSEEEKLAQPSFERFTSGIAVGSDVFTVAPDQPVGTLEYETHYLGKDERFDRYTVRFVDVRARLSADDLRVAATLGAVARSDLHRVDRTRPPDAAQIAVTDAPLAAATTTGMATTQMFTGTARYSSAVAAEQLDGDAGLQLVEAFEVAGA